MALDYSIERLQAVVAQRPFEAFVWKLPNGEKLIIADPAALAIRGHQAAYLTAGGSLVLWDEQNVRWVPAPLPRPARASLKVLNALVAAQLLAIGGSVLAATIEIESIVGTGPVVSVLGLIVAASARRNRSLGALLLGLSAGLLSLFVFALIAVQDWGPSDAAQPVSMILITYEMVAAPIGLFAIGRTISPAESVVGLWQFDLRTMLGLIGLLAVALAAGRMGHNLGLKALAAVATGGLLAVILALLFVGYRWWRLSDGQPHPLTPEWLRCRPWSGGAGADRGPGNG
jgi:hypothetical protein